MTYILVVRRPCRRPTAAILGFLKILKAAGISPSGSQVVHQISKGSVKRFKSYRNYKNPRWPPAYGRHLGFFENFKVAGCSSCGSQVAHQISKRSVKRFKGYRNYKIQDGGRPPSCFLGHELARGWFHCVP
jgi:hypothetical protein